MHRPDAPVTFYSAWFCPYAQRAWIALNHHRVPYTLCEALQADAPGRDFTGYIKHPDLLTANPKGLVPTILPVNARVVTESLRCVTWAEDEATKRGSPNTTLLRQVPCKYSAGRPPAFLDGRREVMERCQWVDTKLCSPFYRVLVRQDSEEQRQGFAELTSAMAEFDRALQQPFFYGANVSAVDITFFPWAYRILEVKALEHYRGDEFKIALEQLPRLAVWLRAMMELPSVRKTLPQPQALLDTYARYARGDAQSKVAEAVRADKAAHEHE